MEHWPKVRKETSQQKQKVHLEKFATNLLAEAGMPASRMFLVSRFAGIP
jgi:hypothetical protein